MEVMKFRVCLCAVPKLVVHDDRVELPIMLSADLFDDVFILFELRIGVCFNGVLFHVGWRYADDGPKVNLDRHVALTLLN
jgi:hypothetical protein